MKTKPIRRRRIAAIVIALTALAATSAGAADDRPYSSRCSTIVTPIGPTQVRIASDCTATHLGATRGDTLQTVMPMGDPMMGMQMVHITNDTTYRAANGDLLTMTFAGHGHIDLATGEVHFMGVEFFTGGSGRFAAAAGKSQVSGTASLVTGLGQFVSKGRISY